MHFPSPLDVRKQRGSTPSNYHIPNVFHIPDYAIVENTLYRYLREPFSFKPVPASVYPPLSYGGHYRVLLAPQYCPTSTAFLFLISSSPEHVKQRYAIRKTWGSYFSMVRHPMRFVFVMGRSGSTEVNHDVNYEAARNRDVLQLEVLASQHNATQILMQAFRWAAVSCSTAKYIVRAHDDSFFYMKGLVTNVLSVAGEAGKGFYYGSCVDKWEYVRDPKSPYFVPKEMVNDDIRWGWCSGSGFVVSADLAPLIALSSCFVPWISGVPDLEVGKTLAMWGVKPFDVNVDRFTANHYSQIHESFRFRYLGFSQMTPDDLFKMTK